MPTCCAQVMIHTAPVPPPTHTRSPSRAVSPEETLHVAHPSPSAAKAGKGKGGPSRPRRTGLADASVPSPSSSFLMAPHVGSFLMGPHVDHMYHFSFHDGQPSPRLTAASGGRGPGLILQVDRCCGDGHQLHCCGHVTPTAQALHCAGLAQSNRLCFPREGMGGR